MNIKHWYLVVIQFSERSAPLVERIKYRSVHQ